MMVSKVHESNAIIVSTAIEKRNANNAIYGLVLVIMVFIGRIQEIIPGLAGISLGKVAFGLTLILYLNSSKRSDIRILTIPQMKYFIALFLLGLVSSLFGYWPYKSFEFMFTSFLNGLLFLYFIVKIVVTRADLNKVLWCLVISVTLLGIKALFSGLERIKAAGSSYDPNDLAFVVVIFLPLTYFMMKNRSVMARLFLVTALIISLAVIMATGSRGGFLGLITVFTGIFIKERFRLINLLFSSGILLLAFLYLAPAGYNEKISSIFKPEADYNRTSSGGRIEIWKRGIQLTLQNPVLGVGPNVFSVGQGLYRDADTGQKGVYMTAHNSFILISSELGFPGLVIFVMILCTSIRSLRLLLRELPINSDWRWVVNSLEIGYLGYVVCGFFLSQAYSYVLFLLVGLTIVVVNLAGKRGLSMTA